MSKNPPTEISGQLVISDFVPEDLVSDYVGDRGWERAKPLVPSGERAYMSGWLAGQRQFAFFLQCSE